MAATALYSPNSGLSFHLPVSENSEDKDIFVLTNPNIRNGKSRSRSKSSDKAENTHGTKVNLLPNVMEKSLLRKLRGKRNAKKSSKEVTFGTAFQAVTRADSLSGTDSISDLHNDNPFHLPALTAGRQYLFSRDSTRPKQRKDTLAVDGSVLVADNVTAKKVEEAITSALKLKDRMREDKAAGVPTNFDFSSQKVIKFIDDDKNLVKEMRKARRMKEQCEYKCREIHGDKHDMSAESVENGLVQRQREKEETMIPGSFKFPKDSDFIQGRNISEHNRKINPIHVAWGLNNSLNDNMKQSYVGRLRKSCQNPLTGALHKEGSSISKRKGKVLNSGDINVTKVWGRPSAEMSQAIPTIQMARDDILEYPPPRASLRKDKSPSTHSSSQKSEKVERASYIEVSSMSDRLTEIMEEPEEE